ncbi:PTS mannose transporter subunit IID [Listeria grandensis]|uniref:PTS system mannose-specific EIIAB component n=1 Tax=Listeria grandensis FSL F6-0971 TaxID=1265819 RepID=W7BG49_9LIST|nr:mannose/fructose/sorbose PTS transporter subunit IIA [Listeria grandensis]EUJ23785.1 PTS system mannose-specific EIIAB component [Listeria grandensis FSL F6-0971]MBC1474214.1 PTS mannose transporter subunit IID [Listeria grandensis]MBC6315123.1 PTS mannose transporter subunit IID [Listeria grandensis]
MPVGIIIGTHGEAARELLKSTEMIIGKQENVEFITFVPGENTDTLIQKFNEKLDAIDDSEGVLFMVDLFGGSPYNAASQIALPKEKMDVITGTNIPMLLETLSMRAVSSFEDLLNTALTAGRDGVKSLKQSLKNVEEDDL